MPLLLAAAAGFLGGLWVKAETETPDSPAGAASNGIKWVVIGGGAFLAYKALKKA